MRDPLHVDCRCKESYISLAAGLESTPSFPGIAFSVVAISLPLLARKDMELTSGINFSKQLDMIKLHNIIVFSCWCRRSETD